MIEREKIRIDFPRPEPEPEPEDGACALCGGVVAGWARRSIFGDPLEFCDDCRRAGPSYRWPRFSPSDPQPTYDTEAFEMDARRASAGLVLWHMEKAIER